MNSSSSRDFRLAEVLAALSLATDLADGYPFEKTLRTCYIAMQLGTWLGLSAAELSDVYYAALLRLIGCTSFAHEESKAFGGDDITLRSLYAAVDFTRAAEVLPATFTGLGKQQTPLRRAKTVANFLARSKSVYPLVVRTHCEIGRRLASRLAMKPGVADALDHMHERWDGKGAPSGLAGDAIHRGARVVQFAHVVELHHQREGMKAACRVARRRAAGQFDPEVAKAFVDNAAQIVAALEEPSVWDRVLDLEPGLPRTASPERLDATAEAFADFVDLKSIYTLGHSSSVAAIAAAAAVSIGLDAEEARILKRAALLHDLGRVSVPNGIWEKEGKLTAAEWERIRLHAYYTERILGRSPLLEDSARIAGLHHERLDGSGYHRNVAARQIPMAARLLAAADVYQALGEPRPHRPALTDSEAARILEAEAAAGRLDSRAVDAVLAARGVRRTKRRGRWPAGLSDREVEVLRLIARGASNKEVAEKLHVSPKTVQHHVSHIYNKIGVATRAGAALFAVENDLLPEPKK